MKQLAGFLLFMCFCTIAMLLNGCANMATLEKGSYCINCVFKMEKSVPVQIDADLDLDPGKAMGMATAGESDGCINQTISADERVIRSLKDVRSLGDLGITK